MGLRFALLGPMSVHDDGVDLTPGTGKQRALLTTLLLNSNQVVGLDRLTAALWDSAPPRSSIANLRTYANRLRTRIPASPCAADPRRLVARHPGYLLQVCPGELDLAEFAERHRRGREALRRGEAAVAVDELGRALLLWRGQAAEDIPRTPELAPRLEALDEQRHGATEDLLRARLLLGATDELVADLRDAVARQPVRERLWATLMMALCRTGDTAGALDAYQAARRALRDHLGLEPGTGLVELHSRILNRDPDVEEPAHRDPVVVADRGAPTVPPLIPAAFVGRGRELAALRAALRPGPQPRVAVVHGPAGSGKSVLAARAATMMAREYPDGQLYVDLHPPDPGARPRPAADALGLLLRGLGVPAREVPAGTEERTYRFRELAGHRRLLVILDNAVDDAQLRPLLAAWPHAATLITSRNRGGAVECATHVELDPLSSGHAVALLAALAGPARVAGEPLAADRIASLCDRQPLALWLAGSRLAARREWTLAALATLLEDERYRLDALSCGDRSVRASLETCYTPLSDSGTEGDQTAAALFRELGRRRLAEVDTATAARLVHSDAATAIAALARLADARLVEPAGADGYRLGNLTLAYAAGLASASCPETACVPAARASAV